MSDAAAIDLDERFADAGAIGTLVAPSERGVGLGLGLRALRALGSGSDPPKRTLD